MVNGAFGNGFAAAPRALNFGKTRGKIAADAERAGQSLSA
jgi:hypothetical protein